MLACAAALFASALAAPAPNGVNPHPVVLVRPPAGPLTAMAQLGRAVFFDPRLSSSGRLSCATCHSPEHAYAPAGNGAVMNGGPALARQGLRAVPSLEYLEREPNFSIGPDNDTNENVSLTQAAAQSTTAQRTEKTARTTAQSAGNLVPQGGLFWDGRADTLQSQAFFPLLNPLEMDGGSVQRVARKLLAARYAGRFTELFGVAIRNNAALLVSEAMFAVGRYQIEDPAFHPYASKYDAWLEGQARFTPAEERGYELFNDPKRGDCAACHLDRPTPDGLPPVFTDHQYEALAVPRNPALAANRQRGWYDLGVCGPIRTDLRGETQFCGMFATPTLRNVATRHAFFHNGVYHTLRQVLDFYNFRAAQPQRVYPRSLDGSVALYNDLPRRYWKNVDVTDPPFDRPRGSSPPLTPAEEDDIIAFLHTLTDESPPAHSP